MQTGPSSDDGCVSLTVLHDELLNKLVSNHGVESEEVNNYLMDSMPYLATSDLSGWKERFAPEAPRPVKRRRCSPNEKIWTKRPPCVECKSDEIIEDVTEGSVVCTACGTIQGILLGTGPANTSVARLQQVGRHVVHRYSRVVYFRSFLASIQGETKPKIGEQELANLRRLTSGPSCTPETVSRALKKLKLGSKYRRHRYSLAVTLSDGHFKPLLLPGDTMSVMLTLFRRVEWYWMFGGKKVVKKRRVFLSYPYVYYQLCYHLNLMQLTGPWHLLQSKALQSKQHEIYAHVCKKAGLKADLKAFR
jgi:hypothetical protein